jgi:hypothetical protein
MKIEINPSDIFYLTIFFTILAWYFDIHRKHHILTFILNHLIALTIALFLSRIIAQLF